MSSRQAVFLRLALVSSTWFAFAREEYKDWIAIDSIREEGATITKVMTLGGLQNLGRVRFARVVLPYEKEVPKVKTVYEWRIEEILSGCVELEELWYCQSQEGAVQGVDSEFRSMRLLSALRSFTKLQSLHMSFIPNPLSGDIPSTDWQLASLRHLSIDVVKDDRRTHDSFISFDFLSPVYSPSLVSLSLSGFPLDSFQFLQSFSKYAPRIRFLFINTWSNTQSYGNSEQLLGMCINLEHLCVIARNKNLHALLSMIPTRRPLSFTTAWYPGAATYSTTWEHKFHDLRMCQSFASEIPYLYVIPGFNKSPIEESLDCVLAKKFGWEVLPKVEVEMESSHYLVHWEELRLRLM